MRTSFLVKRPEIEFGNVKRVTITGWKERIVNQTKIKKNQNEIGFHRSVEQGSAEDNKVLNLETMLE